MSIIVLHVVCERDLFTFVCMCILCTYVYMCGNRHYYILFFFFLDEGTKQRVKPLIVIFYTMYGLTLNCPKGHLLCSRLGCQSVVLLRRVDAF